MSESDNKLSYKQLFLFFLPLGITPTLIGMSHSVVDAGLARLPSPELSIAVFSIVKGISNVIKGPIYISRQVIASMVDSKESYYKTMKFLIFLCSILLFILMLLAYTPLGAWFLNNIIGLKETEQINFTYYALRIACFLPICELLRNAHQGIVISIQNTKLILPGIILRLLFASILLWWTVHTQAILGVVAGSLAWVVGMGLEGLFLFLSLFYLYKSPARAAEMMPNRNQSVLSYREIFKFFLPLALMMSLGGFLQPIIQSGLARSYSSTQSLAAFGVALSLLTVLTGALGMLHNVSLVYAEKIGDKNWPYIFRFCLYTGILISILIFTLAVTPIGFWVFNRIIGVSVEITEIARKIMLVFSFIPLIRVIREAYWGVLMTERNTRMIGVAKGANIVAVASSLALGLLFLKFLHPAVIGAISYTLGEGIETVFIIYQAATDKAIVQGVKRYIRIIV